MLHWLKEKSGSPKRGKQAHGDLMWHPYRHAMISDFLIFSLTRTPFFALPARICRTLDGHHQEAEHYYLEMISLYLQSRVSVYR